MACLQEPSSSEEMHWKLQLLLETKAIPHSLFVQVPPDHALPYCILFAGSSLFLPQLPLPMYPSLDANWIHLAFFPKHFVVFSLCQSLSFSTDHLSVQAFPTRQDPGNILSREPERAIKTKKQRTSIQQRQKQISTPRITTIPSNEVNYSNKNIGTLGVYPMSVFNNNSKIKATISRTGSE